MAVSARSHSLGPMAKPSRSMRIWIAVAVEQDVADAGVAVDDALREDELEGVVGVAQRGQGLGEEGAVAGGEPGVGGDALFGVGEGVELWEVQVFRGG